MIYHIGDREVEALDSYPGKRKRGMSPHKQISFIKSAVRILGYAAGAIAFYNNNHLASTTFIVLIFSEGIGIIEELEEE